MSLPWIKQNCLNVINVILHRPPRLQISTKPGIFRDSRKDITNVRTSRSFNTAPFLFNSLYLPDTKVHYQFYISLSLNISNTFRLKVNVRKARFILRGYVLD